MQKTLKQAVKAAPALSGEGFPELHAKSQASSIEKTWGAAVMVAPQVLIADAFCILFSI